MNFSISESLNWQTLGASKGTISYYACLKKKNLNYERLNELLQKKQIETGAYSQKCKMIPGVINGAMKVISGLDWLEEIHCLKN